MYDCIVVGAGVIGACAAYDLVKKGKKTLVIEQFPLPHSRGSSHGPIRLLSLCHKDPVYVRMGIDSIPMWKHLEEQSGSKLLRKTGCLFIDKYPFTDIKKREKSAMGQGFHYTVLSSSEIRHNYPGLIDIPEGQRAFFEKDTYTVKSDKAMKCLMEQIKAHGGNIRDEEKVEAVIPGRTISIRTNKGTYTCKTLILAPGSWASQLLQSLGVNPPIRVTRATVCYWKEPTPGITANYPVVIDRGVDRPKGLKEAFFGYGFPSDEYPGLRKIGVHYGTETHPDERDNCPDDKEFLKILADYVKSRFPGMGERPSIVESCIYSDTPDEGIIIDTVPHQPNIAFCCGLSGSGFRGGMMAGRLLAELVFGVQLSYDITSFSLSRFPQTFTPAKY